MNIIFNNPNNTIIFINIVLSILTVFLIYLLAKNFFSRKIGIVTSLLLIFNPIFWFYGVTATIYMSTAFFATLIASTSYQFLRGDDRFLYLSSIIVGLSGGFRPELMIFMFPLWLFCLSSGNIEYKKLMKGFMVLIGAFLLWFIPTIALTGGYADYSLLAHQQLMSSFTTSSVFFGANIIRQWTMDYNLIHWTLIAIGTLNIFILGIFMILNLKTIPKILDFKNIKTILLILWIIPAFSFYLLIFIAKPGYTLIYLPIFALIIGYVMVKLSSNLNKRFKIPKTQILVLILLSSTIFSTAQFILYSETSASYGDIKKADANVIDINQSLKEFQPENTLVFMEYGDDWRIFTYYHPDYESFSYYSVKYNGKNGLLHYKNHSYELSEVKDFKVSIDSSTNRILWIVNDNTTFFTALRSKIELKTLELPDGFKVYYSDIKNNTSFEVNNIIFTKE